MSRKRKYSVEIMLSVIQQYLNGEKSVVNITEELDVSKSTVRKWIQQYDKYGENYFINTKHNSTYTKEFKEMVIIEYLEGLGSAAQLSIKHNIRSELSILSWVKKYNRLEVITDYNPMGEVYMSKVRKTTKEEKIEIVKYCISNNYDYKGSADLYGVSYARIYDWVKKYNINNEDGLTDNRGRKKVEFELSELDKLQREVTVLKYQLNQKEMETTLLKKVKEIEGRGFYQDLNKKRST